MSTFPTRKLHSAVRRDASWAIDALRKFGEDRCAAMAASIAFYSAFSLAPMLVMVIAVAGWFFGPAAARGQIFEHVHGLLGNDAAAGVQTIVENAHRSGSAGGIAAIISFGLLAIGASATFASLNSALSVVWPAADRRLSTVIALVRVRLISRASHTERKASPAKRSPRTIQIPSPCRFAELRIRFDFIGDKRDS